MGGQVDHEQYDTDDEAQEVAMVVAGVKFKKPKIARSMED